MSRVSSVFVEILWMCFFLVLCFFFVWCCLVTCLFGAEIESIRTFDPLTQLSQKKIASVTIVPNIQTHFSNDKKTSVLEVFPANTIIWFKDMQILMEVFAK